MVLRGRRGGTGETRRNSIVDVSKIAGNGGIFCCNLIVIILFN